jgi:hypothetical protein
MNTPQIPIWTMALLQRGVLTMAAVQWHYGLRDLL